MGGGRQQKTAVFALKIVAGKHSALRKLEEKLSVKELTDNI